MKRRMMLITVLIVTFIGLALWLMGGEEVVDGGANTVPASSWMPVPGFEDVPEMIVTGEEVGEGAASSGMPVPGFEGVPEMIVSDEESGEGAVSSGMPVPGFENVPEMIVTGE